MRFILSVACEFFVRWAISEKNELVFEKRIKYGLQWTDNDRNQNHGKFQCIQITNLIEIYTAILEMKRANRGTETTFPLCAQFVHSIQRMHLGIDGEIILKCILQNGVWLCGLVLAEPRHDQMRSFCEIGNGFSNSVKVGNFLTIWMAISFSSKILDHRFR